MTPQRWLSNGKYFNYKSYRIFYNTVGKGEPLLLLHGFPTASYDWHLIIDDLAKKYQVIYFDMIGYGFSDKPVNYEYSVVDQADLTEALVNFLNIEHFHILAHDKGDTVANELIARQNETTLSVQLESCCFLNGGLFPGIHQPRPIQWLLMTWVGKYITPFYTKWMLTKTFNKIFGPETLPTEQEMNDYWFLLDYNNGRQVFHQLIWYMQDRIDHEKRWLSALQQTKVPLRLIDGEFDPISGKHMGLHYEKVIPNPDVVYLKNIGHYPQVEAPKDVLHYYFEFRK